MSFVYPYLLWGLLAVSIPVIIHLFNFRRYKKVYFTNVKYLLDLKLKTRRQSQLRHLVILLMRILAVASLVTAFAQPFIPSHDIPVRKGSVNLVSIYIDNSFSMGSLLEPARQKAVDVTEAYGPSDLFQLLTNDFEGRHQRWVSRDEFKVLMNEITPSPVVRTASEVTARQADMLKSHSSENKNAYLVSDFQKSMFDISLIARDPAILTWLIPVASPVSGNLFIDTCWFESPVHQTGQSVRMVARIMNAGEGDMEKIPVKLSIDDSQKALASVDIPAGSFSDVALSFTHHEGGRQYGTVEIADFPVTFDDKIYFICEVEDRIPVLCICRERANPFLASLFERDSAFAFEVNDSRSVDYEGLEKFRLILLDGLEEVSTGLAREISTFVDNGGTVAVVPPSSISLESYRQFLQGMGLNYYLEEVHTNTRVDDIDMMNPVFDGVFEENSRVAGLSVDLPVVRHYYRISRLSATSRIPVLTLVNGDDFLSCEFRGRSAVYLLASPLDDSSTNFHRHAVFVPTLYRIGLLSASSDRLYYTIGDAGTIEVPASDTRDEAPLKLVSRDEGFEMIPGQGIYGKKALVELPGRLPFAGHFTLRQHDQEMAGLAFNYDRRESDLDRYDPDEIGGMVSREGLQGVKVFRESEKPLTDMIAEMNQGVRLWKLFIILALSFLAAEVALLRFWV
jgi:hypothetical protein